MLRDHQTFEQQSGVTLLPSDDWAWINSLAATSVDNIMAKHLDKRWMLAREEVAHDWTNLDEGNLDSLEPKNIEEQERCDFQCLHLHLQASLIIVMVVVTVIM